MDIESRTLDRPNLGRLRERLVVADIARRFFDDAVNLARKQKLAWLALSSLAARMALPAASG
jgi:hypothetical protein